MLLLGFLLLPVALMADGVNVTHTPLVVNATDMTDKVVKICIVDDTYNGLRIISINDGSINVCETPGPDLDNSLIGSIISVFIQPLVKFGYSIIGRDLSPFTLDLTATGAVIFESGWHRPLVYIVRDFRRSDPIGSYYLNNQCAFKVCVVIMNGNEFERLERVSIEKNNTIALLDLNDNRIKSIEAGCFRNLTELVELQLERNQIESLEKGVFAGLEKIRKISLKLNLLTKCARGVFAGMGHSLKSIHLDYNSISDIENGSFNSSSLSMLTFYKNSMTKINRDMFEEVPNLSILHLPMNKISDIDGIFLPHLEHLNLYGNRLTKIVATTFERLPKLEYLSLRHNEIQVIEDGATQYQRQLYILDLAYNPITVMEEGCLSGCLSERFCTVCMAGVPEWNIELERFGKSRILFSDFLRHMYP